MAPPQMFENALAPFWFFFRWSLRALDEVVQALEAPPSPSRRYARIGWHFLASNAKNHTGKQQLSGQLSEMSQVDDTELTHALTPPAAGRIPLNTSQANRHDLLLDDSLRDFMSPPGCACAMYAGYTSHTHTRACTQFAQTDSKHASKAAELAAAAHM